MADQKQMSSTLKLPEPSDLSRTSSRSSSTSKRKKSLGFFGRRPSGKFVEPPEPILKNGNYTAEELKEYRQVFQMFDTDRSGSIGTEELGNAMHSLGVVTNPTELQDLIREVDEDGNGEIDFEEFCAAMKRMNKKHSMEDTIRQCFDVFNYNDSSITLKEFSYILKTFGDITDESLLEEIFAENDVDANGIIDYFEFGMMVRNYLSDDDLR